MVLIHKYETQKGASGSRRYAKTKSLAYPGALGNGRKEYHSQQGALHSQATSLERYYLTEKYSSTRLNCTPS